MIRVSSARNKEAEPTIIQSRYPDIMPQRQSKRYYQLSLIYRPVIRFYTRRTSVETRPHFNREVGERFQ